MTAKRRVAAIGLGLAGAILLAYLPVLGNGFVNFDDYAYLWDGSLVRDGLSARGLVWAFTTTHAGNWHPLTWLSHMADVQAFGMDARWHHGASLALHAANAVLLFLGLRSLTGATRASAVVAALFGLHPLHVEAVAWTSERKELLCTFFWLLAAGAYVRQVRRPRPFGGVPAFALLALALLAKPMAVTAPLVFLLLDFWPLGRLAGLAQGNPRGQRVTRLLLEKAPLFALAGAAAIVTYLVQSGSGAIRSMERLPLGLRVANAAVSTAGYALQALLPRDLAVFYPHPMGGLDFGKALAAAVALAAVTALVLARARRAPHLAWGWCLFLVTLAPVIGIVQAGGQGMADRYTYVPLTGLFVAAVWGVRGLPGRAPAAGRLLAPAVAAALLGCAALTWRQASYWRDSVTLYERALAVTPPSWIVVNSLATAWYERGDLARAERQYRRALGLQPRSPESLVSLGIILARTGRVQEADGYFQAAMLADPKYPKARLNYGLALAWKGRGAEALVQLREAVRLDAAYAEGRLALGTALEAAGIAQEASAQLREAFSRDPGLIARKGEYEQLLRRAFPRRDDGGVPAP
ncbi:MAG TPA: tetratricopeptide repeat protein [bacterium]